MKSPVVSSTGYCVWPWSTNSPISVYPRITQLLPDETRPPKIQEDIARTIVEFTTPELVINDPVNRLPLHLTRDDLVDTKALRSRSHGKDFFIVNRVPNKPRHK